MLAVTRKGKIKDIIIEQKSVTVSELSTKFNVTEETIRRDLKSLEDENFLTRTYGGAFIQSGVENNVNPSLREFAYVKSKELIADQAKTLIHNGDSIYLDSSTTALFIARVITDMRLTVITNSILIVNQLEQYDNIKLICVGGTFSRNHKAFHGTHTLQTIANYFVDKAFVSCRSLSIDHGITDSTEGEAAIRKLLLKQTNEIYFIADYSKFNKTSFIRICDFSEVTGIITDKPLSAEWVSLLAQVGTKLLCSE